MQAEVVRSVKPQEFEPFDLVIRVESEDEAYRLWHRFNVSIKAIVARSTGDVPDPNLALCDPIAAFNAIDDELARQGLKSPA